MFFISGCGNKLSCTYEKNYDDVKIKNKIEFNFKDNTYKEIDKMIFKDSKTASDYFKDVIEYVEEYNLRLEDNIIVSDIKDEIKFNGDKNKIKKQYESYDYKCK